MVVVGDVDVAGGDDVGGGVVDGDADVAVIGCYCCV